MSEGREGIAQPPNVLDDARDFTWLLERFVADTAGVAGAVAVSSDGLLMAHSSALPLGGAEQVGAIVAALIGLGRGAARSFGYGGLNQVMVSMDEGFLIVSSISDGSAVGVIAARTADIGLVGYQTTLLVERAGTVLSPALIAQLRGELLAGAR